jgi:hypothetical protein
VNVYQPEVLSPEADLRSRASVHTQNGDIEKSSGQATQLNILTTMDRTSAQPGVGCANSSFWIGPLAYSDTVRSVGRQMKQCRYPGFGYGLDPDSIRSVDPDPYSESGYGSWRAKMTHKRRKN